VHIFRRENGSRAFQRPNKYPERFNANSKSNLEREIFFEIRTVFGKGSDSHSQLCLTKEKFRRHWLIT
jgi:hypothetical protein